MFRSSVNAQSHCEARNALLPTAGKGTLPPAGVERGFGWLLAALGGGSAVGAGVELRLFGSARTLPPAGLLAASTLRLFAAGAAFAGGWASFVTADTALHTAQLCVNIVTAAATISATCGCIPSTKLHGEVGHIF
jgi:hypothetical protein